MSASDEQHRNMARRYVEKQEKAQKERAEKISSEQREIKDRQVEGIHRHMYDSMDKSERREAFGRG